MKLAILLVVGAIAILCVTGYLAYMDFADTVVGFFKSPQHYRISTRKGLPRKELRFHRRQYVLGDNSTADEKLAARTLKIFNSVRAVVASGRLGTLMDFIRSMGVLQNCKLPLGPAANMMKLEWNRTMEDMVKKKITGKNIYEKFEKFFTPVNITGYISFYWLGGIENTLKEFQKNYGGVIDLKMIDHVIPYAETVETILALIYLAVDFPGSVNIKGKKLGPSNALVASRHQIGCSSNGIYSICIVEDDGAEVLYEEGVTCWKCPHSDCEWRVQPDDSYMEGDMCIYNPEKAAAAAAAAAAANATNETTTALVESTGSRSTHAPLVPILMMAKLAGGIIIN